MSRELAAKAPGGGKRQRFDEEEAIIQSMRSDILKAQLKELLLQSLEHELCGVKIYQTALECAQNEDLESEWEIHLDETRSHVAVLLELCRALDLDPAEDTAGRRVVRHLGSGLVETMNEALAAGDPAAAELVATECVVLAETKDHLGWALIGSCAEVADGRTRAALERAYDQVQDQQDEHLRRAQAWCRELWSEALGLDASLPPEEEPQVRGRVLPLPALSGAAAASLTRAAEV